MNASASQGTLHIFVIDTIEWFFVVNENQIHSVFCSRMRNNMIPTGFSGMESSRLPSESGKSVPQMTFTTQNVVN